MLALVGQKLRKKSGLMEMMVCSIYITLYITAPTPMYVCICALMCVHVHGCVRVHACVPHTFPIYMIYARTKGRKGKGWCTMR